MCLTEHFQRLNPRGLRRSEATFGYRAVPLTRRSLTPLQSVPEAIIPIECSALMLHTEPLDFAGQLPWRQLLRGAGAVVGVCDGCTTVRGGVGGLGTALTTRAAAKR